MIKKHKAPRKVSLRKKIADKTESSEMMISYLVRNKCKTTIIPLAIEVARMTGKKPSFYLNSKIKELAIEIDPSLDCKMTKSV